MYVNLKSNHGSTMALPMIMAALSVIIFGSVGMISYSNRVTNINLNKKAAKAYVLRELKTIIADPGLCLGTVEIDHATDTFEVAGLLEVDQAVRTINGATISNLYLTNKTNIVGNIWEADFNIDFSFNNVFARFFDQADLSTRVRYTLLADGTIADCGLSVSSEEACGQLGLIWDDGVGLCDICASMGGTMSGAGVCDL